MLTLIGLGLWDEKDMTIRGLEAAKAADEIFLETYTSRLFGTKREKLEWFIGKSIKDADREAVESGHVLDNAVKKNVVILVGGDPMVATTHSDLVLRAKGKGIDVKIIHNSSIYSAIGETGLQAYKFGRSATVTFWQDNYKPTSFYDVITENRERGLHTLLFLDIQQDKQRYLSPNEAFQTLLSIAKEKKDKSFTDETPAVVCSRMGADDKKIMYGPIHALMAEKFEPLSVIIIPGKMHDLEKQYLEDMFA